MRIEVTQEDIDKGKPSDIDCCPLAIAIQRATGCEAYVSPDSAHVYCPELDIANDIELPDDAVDFIGKFDVGNPVAPFAFDLDL